MSVLRGVCNKQSEFRERGRAREASHADIFSGAFVWEGSNTSSPKNACMGDLGTKKTVCNNEVSVSSGCL